MAAISRQPVGTYRGSLPEKRSYGSDFPFRNVGQLDGVHSEGRANRLVVSSAYGGFSNVWGAQTMPWSTPTFDQWPIKWSEMEPHYRSVLHEVPLTGVDDDLSELFPLLVDAQDPPKLAERSRMVLDRYGDTTDSRTCSGHNRGRSTVGAGRRVLRALWIVHDRLPVFAHLLRFTHFRPPASGRPDQLPAGPAGLPHRRADGAAVRGGPRPRNRGHSASRG